jgi:ketosteroid isomerase-like protein
MAATDVKRQQALDEAIAAFGEAWARGDMATLERLLSPSYTHNDAFGARHDHASWLAYARGRQGRATTIEFHDVRTRIFGDMAVVTGCNVMRGGGATSAADSQDLSIVFTQVWRWQEGRWLREAFQATPVRGDTTAS